MNVVPVKVNISTGRWGLKYIEKELNKEVEADICHTNCKAGKTEEENNLVCRVFS